jgi:hypothetical protein
MVLSLQKSTLWLLLALQ